MYCLKCGKEIENGAAFCRYCGTPQEEVVPEKSVTAQDVNIKKKDDNLKTTAIIAIAAVVLLLLIAVVGGIFILIRHSIGTNADDGNLPAAADVSVDDDGYSSGGSDADAAAGDNDGLRNITVRVVGANETGAVSSAEIGLSGKDTEISAVTDENGQAVLEDLSDGEYTISCHADGYNGREIKVTVAGTDLSPVIALVPNISGDDAIVLLTWEGDHDLDLCAFNSELKEYVNIGHPMDSEGNVFLYADHGADMPYEVIYIHNAAAEVPRTFYVTEAGNARNGEPSQMEADGVSIYIYDQNGLVYSAVPDPDETAALWCPCYFYAGTVYDQGDYIYDTTGEEYAWISFDEKDAVAADAGDPAGSTAQDDSWKTAYLEIVNEQKKLVTENEKGIGVNYSSKDSQQAALIYLNDDDIPELVIKTFGLAEYELTMLSYVDGSSLAIAWSDVIEYYPRAGMYYGNEDCDAGWVGVCSWNGKERTVLWESGLYDMDLEEPVISDEEVEKNVA